MSDKPAEQAYHARGAGREERKFEEVLELHVNSSESMRETYRRTANSDMENFQEGFTEGVRRAIEVYGNWRIAREPGADTGTTPPERPWRGVEDMLNRIDRRMDDEMGFGDDTGTLRRILAQEFNAALAATQQAPVEQGRARKVKFKIGDVVMLFADVETSLSNGDYALKTEGGNHIAESARNLYEIESSAPDHAREGVVEFVLEQAARAETPREHEIDTTSQGMSAPEHSAECWCRSTLLERALAEMRGAKR